MAIASLAALFLPVVSSALEEQLAPTVQFLSRSRPGRRASWHVLKLFGTTSSLPRRSPRAPSGTQGPRWLLAAQPRRPAHAALSKDVPLSRSQGVGGPGRGSLGGPSMAPTAHAPVPAQASWQFVARRRWRPCSTSSKVSRCTVQPPAHPHAGHVGAPARTLPARTRTFAAHVRSPPAALASTAIRAKRLALPQALPALVPPSFAGDQPN
jgi:hypothetical protein